MYSNNQEYIAGIISRVTAIGKMDGPTGNQLLIDVWNSFEKKNNISTIQPGTFSAKQLDFEYSISIENTTGSDNIDVIILDKKGRYLFNETVDIVTSETLITFTFLKQPSISDFWKYLVY